MENNIYSSYTDKELFNAWESINSDIEYNEEMALMIVANMTYRKLAKNLLKEVIC